MWNYAGGAAVGFLQQALSVYSNQRTLTDLRLFNGRKGHITTGAYLGFILAPPARRGSTEVRRTISRNKIKIPQNSLLSPTSVIFEGE